MPPINEVVFQVQDFIVLGLIPGTNYQITFILWLYLTAGLLLFALALHYAPKRHVLYTYLLARKVARLIKHYQLG
jgi:hypothetical protein